MNTQAYWEGYAEACLTRGINPMALQKQALDMSDFNPMNYELDPAKLDAMKNFATDPRVMGAAGGGALGAIGGGMYGGGQGALMGGLGGAALGAGGGQLYDMYGGSGDGGGATPTVTPIRTVTERLAEARAKGDEKGVAYWTNILLDHAMLDDRPAPVSALPPT